MATARATPTRLRSLAARLSWLPAIGIASVPVLVVPAILWARITYHALHPDADPNVYLTISRAISDPAVGEPFAFWITVAAVILWTSVHAILWMFIAEHPRPPAIGVGRDRVARGLWPVMWVAMTATCVGMVMLSNFRFGTTTGENRLHMIGSYVFFAGQAATILLAAIYHSLVGPARAAVETSFFPARWRARAGYAVVVAAVLYGVFFQMKSMDLGPATRWVVSIYVELETVLILVFLTYLAAYFVDVSRFTRSRGSRREIATTPADAVPNLSS
jgi:hypothetical protein